MKHSVYTLIVCALLLSSAILPDASAQPSVQDDPATELERSMPDVPIRNRLTPVQWSAYAGCLSDALASGHEGLQQSALRLIIQYGEYMQFARDAVFGVVRVYRDHPNDDMRLMAVVALGQMHDAWAFDFLTRSVRFEKTPKVRSTIRSVLALQSASSPSGARG